jgi:hypothetical protein
LFGRNRKRIKGEEMKTKEEELKERIKECSLKRNGNCSRNYPCVECAIDIGEIRGIQEGKQQNLKGYVKIEDVDSFVISELYGLDELDTNVYNLIKNKWEDFKKELEVGK